MSFTNKLFPFRVVAAAPATGRRWWAQETKDGELLVFHDATLDRALPAGSGVNAAPEAALRAEVLPFGPNMQLPLSRPCPAARFWAKDELSPVLRGGRAQ